MSKRLDKRVWGVLGKQQTYYSPQKQVEGKQRVPLNPNAFDSWDVKRSRYKRVDGYSIDDGAQQGGVVPEPTSTNIPVSPTPTPSITPTNTSTPTPSITPSSTPIIDCYWDTNNDNWENDSTLWNDCINVPTPTPSPTNTTTPTNTPTNTNTPTSTTTPTITPTPSSTPPASGTTEANTYLAAVIAGGGTGITSTESGATQTLFTELVSNGLWEKMTLFYPMLGGNSGGMKVNGKNPGTNDLTFNGGWTFDVSGATGNGTNAYANTDYKDSNLSQNDMHMAVYTNVGTSNNGLDCGVASASGNSRTSMYVREVLEAGFTAHRANSGYLSWNNAANTGLGLYVSNRTASNNEEGYVNGVEKASGTTASVAGVGLPHILGGRYGDAGAEGYSNRRYCWYSLGSGLTDAQQQTFSTIVNTFNTTLNRNTY